MSFQTPTVFISFATPDEPHATMLARGLEDYGITVFIFHRDVLAGANIVNTIEEPLTTADYFVLLWSRHAGERAWVNLEWTTALSRELDERRSFLFVVRLDDLPLPRLLTTRRTLAARGDVTSVVPELVLAWQLDVAAARDGVPRRPAPRIDGATDGEETVGVYVINRDVGVQHFARVPRRLSCRQLHARVRSALELPASSAVLGGRVVVLYRYELLDGDRPLPADSDERVDLFDETTLELVISIDLPPGSQEPAGQTVEYRDWQDNVLTYIDAEQTEIRAVLRANLRHLLP